MKTESHQNLCMFRQLLSLLAALLCAWQALAGTPVLMADGRFMPIEDIECGDSVLACVDGENVPAEVTDVFRGETMEWVNISVAGQIVRATPGHLFRVGEEWVEARNLRAGMSLQSACFAGQPITEISVVCLTEPETTYNLEIQIGKTYYVTENSVLVHNRCSEIKDYPSRRSAFRGAKADAGIPRSAQWKSIKINRKTGEIIYIFEIDGTLLYIQEHPFGHNYPGMDFPHFNNHDVTKKTLQILK